MSVVCALKRGGQIWIGSDTISVDGTLLTPRGPKWVLHDGWAVGFVGNARIGCLIETHKDGLFKDLEPGMFPDRLRAILKEADFNTDSDTGAPGYGIGLLLVNSSGIWDICSGMSIQPIEDFWAQGSGRELALGAVFAYDGPPEQTVRNAVAAAVEYDTHCGGEPWVFHVK